MTDAPTPETSADTPESVERLAAYMDDIAASALYMDDTARCQTIAAMLRRYAALRAPAEGWRDAVRAALDEVNLPGDKRGEGPQAWREGIHEGHRRTRLAVLRALSRFAPVPSDPADTPPQASQEETSR